MGFKSLEGKIIGQDVQSDSVVLSLDERGAMINDIVDKYLRKELTNEYMEKVKAEHSITAKDIVREIAKRQIKQALGLR